MTFINILGVLVFLRSVLADTSSCLKLYSMSFFKQTHPPSPKVKTTSLKIKKKQASMYSFEVCSNEIFVKLLKHIYNFCSTFKIILFIPTCTSLRIESLSICNLYIKG